MTDTLKRKYRSHRTTPNETDHARAEEESALIEEHATEQEKTLLARGAEELSYGSRKRLILAAIRKRIRETT